MINKSYRLTGLIFFPILLVLAWPVCAAEKTSFNLGHFNGLAMNGYDVMSYWQGGEPIKGDEQYQYEYEGATWLFVSQQHMETFATDPSKYAPQYGGYCAYAASQGQLADVDPFSWRIWNDQLYLNYSPQVMRIWASDIDENIKKGNDNWTRINSVLIQGD